MNAPKQAYETLFPQGLIQADKGWRFGSEVLALLDFVQQEAWPKAGSLADLGAGCGVIGLALARLRPELQVRGLERQAQICACLEQNIERYKPNNYKLIQGDIRDRKILDQARRSLFCPQDSTQNKPPAKEAVGARIQELQAVQSLGTQSLASEKQKSGSQEPAPEQDFRGKAEPTDQPLPYLDPEQASHQALDAAAKLGPSSSLAEEQESSPAPAQESRPALRPLLRPERAHFGAVIANPPWLLEGSGRPSPQASRQAGLFGADKSWQDFAQATEYLLKPKGSALFLADAANLPSILNALTPRLRPLRLQSIYTKPGKARWIIVELRKDSQAQFEIMAPKFWPAPGFMQD